MKKAYFIIRHPVLIIPLAVFAALSLVFFSGCQTIDTGKAVIAGKFGQDVEIDKIVKVLEKFFNLIMEKDYDEAYQLISHEDHLKESEESFKKEFSNVTDIIDYEINWVEIKNNIAIAGMDLIDSYDGMEKTLKDIEVSLVKKENEDWKIVFWK